MTTLLTDPATPIASPITAVLPNGLSLLVRRDASAPAVAIVTYVNAGYFDETDDVVGIAHVLEHMYFKGTPTRGVGEIARETKASGGYLNAHTIYDHTSYYTVVPAAAFSEALAIQSDAYAHSLIDAGELAREIEVIVQEVRRKEDSPGAVATEGLYALMFDRHRMRRWRMGRPDALRTFTRERVRGFYENFYRPGNTIVSIVGDVDPERVRAEVEERYGGLPNGAVHRVPGPAEPGPLPEPRYRESSGDILQTQVVLGWRTVPTLHADTPLLDLAAMVLGTGRGSRLYRAVRERQLATAATAYNYTPTELGVFVTHAECPPERAHDAARAMWGETQRMLEEGIEPAELLRAQRLLESRSVRRTESMEGQASYLAEWQALGGWQRGDEYLARALAATPGDVATALRRYVSLEQIGAVVYRPASSAQVADSPAALVTSQNGQAGAGATQPNGERSTEARAWGRPARPRVDGEEAGVRLYRTPAGVPILVRRKPGSAMMHAAVSALGGAREELAEGRGVTTLLARSALKGAGGRSAAAFADAIEMLGGSIGASVSNDAFGWSVSVPARHTAAALELLADVAQRPLLTDEAIETERTLALVELETLRDDMYRYPVRLATQAAYGAHPYGVGPLGTEESLRALSAEAVRAWHERHVRRAPLAIGIVTDGDLDDIAALIATAFAELSPAAAGLTTPPGWPDSSTVRVETREKAQTALALAFPGPARRDRDRVAAELVVGAASGLGGRFFEELRDRQSLAYTVHVRSVDRELGGMFVGYIATSPEKELVARRGLLAEFAKLAESGITDAELEAAKTYALGTHAIARQNGGALLGEMLDAWLVGTGLAELETYPAHVREVSPADVRRVAATYFDPSRVVEGAVRGVTPQPREAGASPG